MNPTKPKLFHQGMLGAVPPAPLSTYTFAPKMQHKPAPTSVPVMPQPAVFIPKYQEIKQTQKPKLHKPYKLTRKHIHNHHMKNSEFNHNPIEESSNLVEVIN